MAKYIIEVETDEILASWELDELRQGVIDWLSDEESSVVTVIKADD